MHSLNFPCRHLQSLWPGSPVNSFKLQLRKIDCAPFKTRSLRFEWETQALSPSVTTTGPTLLNVLAGSTQSPGTGSTNCAISVSIAGVAQTPETFLGTTATQNYTWSIPAGTNLSTISVQATATSIASGGAPTLGQAGSCSLSIEEIYIQ